MTRPFVTFAALSTLALFACRTEQRDRFPVNDETGDDEDCPGCFDAAYMLWNLQGALHDGDLQSVNTDSGERPALLSVVLVDVDWWWALEDAATDEYIDPFDYSCTMTYTPTVRQGTTAPSAMLDWEIDLEPVSNDCGELDADWVDSDFHTQLADWGMEMIAEPLDSKMEANLITAFAENEQDWDVEGAPFYFGFSSLVDGRVVYKDDDGETIQGHYGRAYAVDEDMAITNEAEGGTLLTPQQIGAEQDAWFEIFAWTFFSPFERLR